MELVTELTEKQKVGRALRNKTLRECCGEEPSTCVPFSDEIEEDTEAYKVVCLKCNTTTAYYETREEAGQAWNNKILM